MPDRDIVMSYRSDGSGTTYTFTDYLSKADPEWAKVVGKGMVVNWPAGLARSGNDGVAEEVKGEDGGIGYVELSYAVTKGIPFALIKNRSGSWVEANPETIAAAAAGLVDQMPADLQQSITDSPGRSSYPIASYSYLLFFKEQQDATKAQAFGKFLDWVLHDGQRYARESYYAALPARVAELASLQLKQITSTNTTVATSCKANLGLAPHSAGPVPLSPEVSEDERGALSSD